MDTLDHIPIVDDHREIQELLATVGLGLTATVQIPARRTVNS